MSKIEAAVYDQFVISRNPVILKCHLPNNDAKEFIKVISWIKDDLILLASSLSTGKFFFTKKILFIFIVYIFKCIIITMITTNRYYKQV